MCRNAAKNWCSLVTGPLRRGGVFFFTFLTKRRGCFSPNTQIHRVRLFNPLSTCRNNYLHITSHWNQFLKMYPKKEDLCHVHDWGEGVGFLKTIFVSFFHEKRPRNSALSRTFSCGVFN